jgi:hypothetical protein
MSYYTVTQAGTLLTGTSPTQALATLAGAPSGPTVNAGDLVTVSDPTPTTIAGYTQVTTTNGTVGWLPTTSLTSGVWGSTVMNLGIATAVAIGVYYLFLRKP